MDGPRSVAQGRLNDPVNLWEDWANANYPQDLGDEGGWTVANLDEWLADVRRAVIADDPYIERRP